MIKNTESRTPEFFCSLSLIFPNSIDLQIVEQKIKKIGFSNIEIIRPQQATEIDINLVSFKQIDWELESVIGKIFLEVDNRTEQLKALADNLKGEILIDIAFYQYGTCPTLTLSSKTLKKIAEINASISIDQF